MADELQHTDAMPTDLTFDLIKSITDDFSEKNQIGHENGKEVAGKKLHDIASLDDVKFMNEFINLMSAQHQNIVQLVGYCYDTRRKVVLHNGKYVVVHVEERALCFEYLQRGSLDNGYMPPEYIQICHITEKFDVFSLGVIIIEIMTGTKETSKRADMSPQQFIELVHENWRRRFELATPMYTSEEVESLRLQVKTCIEMALQCVEAQRLKRPTIAEVVSRLNILDDMVRKISPSLLLYKPPIDPLSSGDQALTKFGPWGGSGDMDRDMEVVPHRLESLTICSADIINSLAFSYNDHNGKQHTVGPWGGDGGAAFTIRLGAFEHIKGLSGTVGSFGMLQNVITSLKFTTNLNRTYGPYGKGGGTPFVVPVEDAASIVGFFGRAGPCVEALGVYIRTYL
uniref:Jacalin-type lectin domain-containing protein n=1 Tax=Oryza barthii TaxID=65489 RepID=A0A0D3HNW5_9ORYZ